VDQVDPEPRYQRPAPRPSAEQRLVDVSATGLDRLRGDPYQFYAAKILNLARLDPLDAEPSAAWRGTAAHAVLDAWHKAGAPPGRLAEFAEAELARMAAHPLVRSLWRPRLLAALDWIGMEIERLKGKGRTVLATECEGAIEVIGVRVHGRADRIDRTGQGRLGIVDYKTGAPPSARQVEEGFALQLGLLGLIARAGGFAGISGDPEIFEYWSLARGKDGSFGYVDSPILTGRKQRGVPIDAILPETERYLHEALANWIVGDEPFTARLNPDHKDYNDFDQLMRLDEWIFDLKPGDAE
jgi:ATP-dependent helicase/nuclease subunit B